MGKLLGKGIKSQGTRWRPPFPKTGEKKSANYKAYKRRVSIQVLIMVVMKKGTSLEKSQVTKLKGDSECF